MTVFRSKSTSRAVNSSASEIRQPVKANTRPIVRPSAWAVAAGGEPFELILGEVLAVAGLGVEFHPGTEQLSNEVFGI